MAYITVSYGDGGENLVFKTAFDAKKNSRSVYEVAVKAYGDKDKYSSTQVEVIEGYIANVIDVQKKADGSFALVDRLGHNVACAYTLVDGSLSENVVTLNLSGVAADSMLAATFNDADLQAQSAVRAAVWYSVEGENGVATVYRATITAYDAANGTATITFTVA